MAKSETRASGPSKASRRRSEQAAQRFVNAFATAAEKGAPHLSPINSSALSADVSVILAKAKPLLSYQRFLADARAVKAQRKGASATFERSVLAQAYQARDDLDALTGSALNVAQQLHQTDIWKRTLARATHALRQTGPATLQSMWDQITGDEHVTELASYGLSAEVVTAITEVIGNIGAATVSVRDGNVSLEMPVAGERRPRRIALTATAPAGPADLSQFLRRSQLDAVMSSLADGAQMYVEAVPTAGVAAYEPSELHAVAAVAARERMQEHVRKLEDSGLATYEGNDPLSFLIGTIIAGLVLGGLGALITSLCDDPNAQVMPPDWICEIGAIMLYTGMVILGAAFIIALDVGVGWAYLVYIGFWLLLVDVIDHRDLIFPDFVPGQTSGQG